MATDKLRSARAWFQGKVPEEGMTVEYLIAIGESRFGLVAAARFLHDVYCRDDKKLEIAISQRQVSDLLKLFFRRDFILRVKYITKALLIITVVN